MANQTRSNNNNSSNGEFDPTKPPVAGQNNGAAPAVPTVLSDNEFADENINDETSKIPAVVAASRTQNVLKNAQRPNVGDAFTGTAIKEAAIDNLGLTPEAQLVKEALAKEPRYPFMVPLDPGEKPGAIRVVTINGFRCEVKKGVMAMFPYSIYQTLVESYQVESMIGHNNPYNLMGKDAETRRALGITG